MNKKIILIAVLSVIGVSTILLFGKKEPSTSSDVSSVGGESSSAVSKATSVGSKTVDAKEVEVKETDAKIMEANTAEMKATEATKAENAGTAAAVATAPEAPKVTPKCYVAIFKAQKVDKKAAEKKNRIELSDSLFGSKEFCVRVDGKPVQFVKASDKSKELWISGLENLESKITVSYCEGGLKLKSGCVIPKDEFLAAMAGESGDEGDSAGQWAGKKGIGSEEQAAEREIASFADAISGDAARSIFTRWKFETQTEESGSTASR